MSALDILIPCKSFRQGKSRLTPVLAAAERQELCRRFFDRTLSLATRLDGRVAVISEDQEVCWLAVRAGAVAIEDQAHDLNAALRFGSAVLATSGAAHSLLVVPIDLPFATLPALERMLAGNADVVIAPDRRGVGTNLLRLSAQARACFRFSYGPNSFHHHAREAEGLQLSLEIVRDSCLAWDVDEPEDFGHPGLTGSVFEGSVPSV